MNKSVRIFLKSHGVASHISWRSSRCAMEVTSSSAAPGVLGYCSSAIGSAAELHNQVGYAAELHNQINEKHAAELHNQINEKHAAELRNQIRVY